MFFSAFVDHRVVMLWVGWANHQSEVSVFNDRETKRIKDFIAYFLLLELYFYCYFTHYTL